MKQGTPLIRLKGADLPYLENLLLFWLRACLKKAFCKMCVTICGRFCPDEGAVAGYGNRIRAKYTAKWGVQIAGMNFQTRSDMINLPIYRHTLYSVHDANYFFFCLEIR